MEMKIIDVKNVSSDKRNRISGGLYVDFISKDNVEKGYFFSLVYNDSVHYFESTDISISGENLKVSAKEVGYFAHNFDQMAGFDLRSLIGLEVNRITDDKEISKIREMTLWC